MPAGKPTTEPLFRDVPAPREDDVPLSVADLDRKLKRAVEGATADARVEGEVVSVKDAGSGHLYFCLKDEREDASIDCVMYRTVGPRARRLIEDGARVVLRGRATVYAPRGKLQFTADDARPAGKGALLEALARVREKLAAEGLFDKDKKRPLPVGPRVIGVVTSGDGAVFHDIVKVAFRRGRVRVVLHRAPVQGGGAAERMARAIATLGRMRDVEAILLARGGGSADDLAAFNEEVLVRAIAAAPVPVVSAVGHAIDWTLADLAADARAQTPSEAAEMLVADDAARRATLEHLRARLKRAATQATRFARAELDRRRRALGDADRLLATPRQTIDERRRDLVEAMRRRTSKKQRELVELRRRLAARHPRAVVAASRADLRPLDAKLRAAAPRFLAAARAELSEAAARLDALSPLRVLARGYAIATDERGRAVLDASELREGDRVRVRAFRGAFTSKVERVEATPSAREETDE